MSKLETGIDNMTRKEVIWQLKGLLLGELRTTTKERKALEYAISSLETDEAYQLEYERTTKNDLPHCQHTDKEIAKSFIEDVEALRMAIKALEQEPTYCPKFRNQQEKHRVFHTITAVEKFFSVIGNDDAIDDISVLKELVRKMEVEE